MLRTLFAAAALTAIAATPAVAQRATPQQQLERALAGRVAGEPVDCIDLHQVRNQRTITHTAILYEIGDTIYVNRPRSGATSLNSFDTQVVRPFGSRLCSVDVVQIVDPDTHSFTGSVFLDNFVPYRRAALNRD